MTVKEAIQILKEQRFPKKPSKCIEYSTCFVFKFGTDEQLDFMFCVDKKTKKLSPFSPLTLSSEDYNNPMHTYNFK